MPDPLPKYDIVIIGAGPVGLTLSTLLARWGYQIKHIDNRATPTATGRADGIQPRSLDLLRNMGLKRAIMAQDPARVYEVAFWDPAPGGKGIVRTDTWASAPGFIDARYPFTTLLHQGHIERVFLRDMKRSGVVVQRPWTIAEFVNDGEDEVYPVKVRIEGLEGQRGMEEVVRTKYLFSGEGAKSSVRETLGIKVIHKDPIAHVWGVMDGVVRTDFPDIKMKCTIHSDAGSIMVIPREDNMVRLYIQIASSTDADFDPRKTATEEEVMHAAKRILKPYNIEWDRVEWYSVYPIGQGISERYTLDDRVILGGDACHTHSPKAGQGMNTAFLDAVNLAWKIHHVESGFATRDILSTYEPERRGVAEELLDFDSKYAKLFSSRLPSAGEVSAASQDSHGEKHDNEFVSTFKASCEFTSGYGVKYEQNNFNWSPNHPAKHTLFLHPDTGGTKLRPGHIFTPSTVTRVVDANVVHLEQEIPLNGSFRIYIFAGKPADSQTALHDFAANMVHAKSFLTSYRRPDAYSVSVHEKHLPHSRFFTFCTIFACKRSAIEISELVPLTLSRYRDHVYADDVIDLRVKDVEIGAAHAKMGFRDHGAVVVVRPDGYVGCVMRLEDGSGTVDALNAYFDAFTTKKLGGQEAGKL